MGLRLTLMSDQPTTAQVYYRPLGQEGYTEASSVRSDYQRQADGLAALEIVIDSAAGFEPALRIDPYDGEGRFRLTELQVACKLSAKP